MKKIIISILLSMGMVGAYAQTTDAPAAADAPLTKSGYKFLPEKGDYALGIDATPFLDFIGNSFNGNQANTLFGGFSGVGSPFEYGANTLAIYGKYFLEADRAVRGKLMINTGSDTDKQTVRDDYAYYQMPTYNGQTVIDSKVTTGTSIALSAGYEFRRGYRRVQGFYGGEIGLGYSTGNTETYEYANPATTDNQRPTTANFAGNVISAAANAAKGLPATPGRILESNPGNRFDVMLGGFVGVEYFIFPKLSIGGELGLQFTAYTVGQTETTMEIFDTTLNTTREISTRERDGDASGIRFQTLPQGNLFLMFYF